MIDCGPMLDLYALHSAPGYHSYVPGVGALCRSEDVLGAVGRYRNSSGHPTSYAVVGYQPWRWGSWRVGAYTGVVTGYRPYPVPMAAALLSIPVGPGEIQVSMIPSVHNVTPALVAISYSWSIKWPQN